MNSFIFRIWDEDNNQYCMLDFNDLDITIETLSVYADYFSCKYLKNGENIDVGVNYLGKVFFVNDIVKHTYVENICGGNTKICVGTIIQQTDGRLTMSCDKCMATHELCSSSMEVIGDNRTSPTLLEDVQKSIDECEGLRPTSIYEDDK